MKQILFVTILLLTFSSCKKSDCQTCTKTIGGFAGNETVETRKVCSNSKAHDLEASSSGTTVWTCE